MEKERKLQAEISKFQHPLPITQQVVKTVETKNKEIKLN